MNKNQVKVSESDKSTEKKHQTEKPGGKHETVLADVNNDSKKDSK
ncbi:hypothetical protein [Nitrincola sp. A-D6]|nr:hypothetical protein [Nitrincola sp. A-D6]